jgi:hypothetical protein
VLNRAEDISREWGNAAMVEADTLKMLNRLPRAAGCPKGQPVIPWLQERGLVEEIDGGWRFAAAKPDVIKQGMPEEDR